MGNINLNIIATNGGDGTRHHGSGVYVNGQRVNPDPNGTFHYEHNTAHRHSNTTSEYL